MADAPTPQDVPAYHSADYRNVVHAGAFVLFAPLLGILCDERNKIPNGRWIVVGFMACVTIWNLFILPRQASGRVIRRPGEGWISGTWIYPLALTVAFALLPLFAAMAAWAAMAGGDACASFIGRRVPKPALAWNEKKSWAGLAGFILGALPFCIFALYWVPAMRFLKSDSSPELPFVWTLAILAAGFGAILESLEGPGDDNWRVPLGVGALLWPASLFLSWATRDLPASTHVQPEFLIPALIVNGILALVVLLARVGDLPATLLGVAYGVLIYFFAHWQGYALFLLFVVVGSGLSKVGRKRKQELGTEEARGGRRGISNVFANLTIPVLCCLAFPVSGGHFAFFVAFAGAIAAALADTTSSEVGTLSRRDPILITSLKAVPHGTNGAVNALGLLAAFVAAGMTAGVACATGFFGLIGVAANRLWLAVAIVIVAGIVGTLVDSLLGATVEDKVAGVQKGAVNFVCTLAGALTAGFLAVVLL